MGIKLDETATRSFYAVCDNCHKFEPLGVVSAWTASKRLRELGWARSGYDKRLEVYEWNCTDCKVKNVA